MRVEDAHKKLRVKLSQESEWVEARKARYRVKRVIGPSVRIMYKFSFFFSLEKTYVVWIDACCTRRYIFGYRLVVSTSCICCLVLRKCRFVSCTFKLLPNHCGCYQSKASFPFGYCVLVFVLN